MEIHPYRDFYILDDGEVREFLFLDQERALLVDTGFPGTPLRETVRQITPLIPQVLLTHGDMDHTGALSSFPACYVHPADQPLISGGPPCQPLMAGDRFCIGTYCFEVLALPGHTPGSIALLDRAQKLLLSGDSIQKGPIYMFGAHRSLPLYIDSLRRLGQDRAAIDCILPSHHAYPLSASYIDYCLEDALALQRGQLTGTPHPTLPCRVYDGRHVQFYA